jgi:Zn-finger nucleic acid-binding protein
MKCPKCQVNLLMTDRSGVEIDYCPECRGVWLDRGELDKIIERSVEPQPAQYRNQGFESQRQPYPSDGYYKKKKRESFLGDLFDF